MFFYANISIYSQSDLDSLRIIWNSDEYPDTIRLKIANTIIWRHYMFSYPDSALLLADQQYNFAKSAGDSIRLGDALNNKASAFYYKGFHKEALIYFNMCLSIANKTHDHKLILGSYMNLSAINCVIKNYDEALYFNKKSFELVQKSKNFFYDKDVLACYYNRASIYQDKKEFNSSINYYNKALSISKEIENFHYTSLIFGNLGEIFIEQKKHVKALEFFNKKLMLSKKINNHNLIAEAYHGIGVSYRSLSKFELAITNLNKSVALKKEMGTIDLQHKNYFELYRAYRSMGNIKMALKMHELFTLTQDSLHEKEAELEGVKIQQIRKFNEIKYKDSIKHIRETLLKKSELKANKKELKKEKLIVDGLIIYCGVILVFLILLNNRFKKTKKQKGIIEEKRQEITDSIQCAKRIQSAILPSQKVIDEFLEDSFIFYKPKDIVAGDFYWLEAKEDRVLFAVADCTGHGVPGALVSVVCNNALNRSVREYELTDPGKILDKTREIVIQEFEKSETEVRDGMDIAICSLIENKLEYAGAHNPLWIVRNGVLLETKANKQPIGKFDNLRPYTTHSFVLEKGDTVYIFSDGYPDQFGGERGKKFKAKAFRELLLSIQDKAMEEQKTNIDEAFETWKGDLEQIDDVCVMGVRV